METDMTGIRLQLEKYGKVQGIMSLVNEETLKEVHKRQPRNKAKGVDEEDKTSYDDNLEENLANLVKRMKAFQYKPLPVRRAYIPKADGRLRPLGIPAYEDRLVQGAMADILNEIYEPKFLECSYGFRPRRNCHDAVRYINKAVMFGNINWVVEADIKGFFDHVNHNKLMEMLGERIKDLSFLRYVMRFLTAGVMESGKYLDSTEGTPQGGLISPVLANVYLHYVLDTWIEKTIKPMMKGIVHYVRYADDFVILLEREDEAMQMMQMLKERLAEYSLEVAEDKTRILPFGPKAKEKEEFDFLGFTFYNTKTRKGWYRVGIKTCMKKLKAKRQLIKQWIKFNMHEDTEELLAALNLKYKGHCQYYGVNGNFPMLAKFKRYLMYITYKTLRRRSQKGKISWEKFLELWEQFIHKPRICVQIWN
ncbi:MAG: group II intron reverse transcriptase/maturase [Desulfovibrio sp.]|nr:group II intron reverse transcriptase/maturase [Desulfovibrio sp.]